MGIIPDDAGDPIYNNTDRMRDNPTVYLIVRTRYLQEIWPLYELEADEVIPEEFEISVEIFTWVMTKCLAPKDVIGRFVAQVQSGR